MREMKESNISWVGKIPCSWKVEKNKHCFQLEKNIVGDNNDKFELLSLTKKGIIKKDESSTGGKVPESFETYQSVKEGQLVMCLFDLDVSAVFSGLSNYDGMISPAYKVYNCNKIIDKNYAKYWFECCFDGRKYKAYSKSLRYVVNTEDFGPIEILLPPKEEQEKIAEFLDKKITEIDSVIDKTKETINDYKMYKQSYINKIITKGLEQNKEKKDSNIDYIGKCPKDWKIIKLKFATKIRNEKYEEKYGAIEYFALENIESESGKFINTDNIYDREGSIICNKDDVVFGKLRPYLAKVYKVKNLSCCSSEFAVFYDFKGKVDYLKYLLLSYGFIKIVDASTYGTKMPRVNIDFIKNMLIPLPNTETQERIASHLNNKCEEIDILIENKQRIIEELEQYKKSLIYEYVTGKKEVV